MSLSGVWERRKTLLFVSLTGLVGTASAVSAGLNLAAVVDMIDATIVIFPSIIDLTIAAIPAIVVFSLVLLLMAVLGYIEEV